MKFTLTILLISLSSPVYSLEYKESATQSSTAFSSPETTPLLFSPTANTTFASVGLHSLYSDTDKLLATRNQPIAGTQEEFHFFGQLTIHQSQSFNLAMTANFTIDGASNHHTSLAPVPIKEVNQAGHYGLVGSYHITPSLHISGGLLHAVPSAMTINTAAEQPKSAIALIGASYSF